MPSDYTDGDILADSFEATIAGDGYVVNNLSLTVPSAMVERNDEKGKLAAKQLLKDFKRINGTAELQIDSEAANVELWGQTFTVPADYNTTGYPLVCIVEEETANVEANASRTRSVSVRLLLIAAFDVDGAGTTAVDGIYTADGDDFVKSPYTLEAFVDAMVVEGAGTAAANDIYLRDGDLIGKPRFTFAGGTSNGDSLYWSGAAWIIQFPILYSSTEDVSTPDLVTTWTMSSGTAPAPTVRRATLADSGITASVVTWRIVDGSGNIVYSNPTASLTPPVSGWVVGTGDADAPTVTRLTFADLAAL